jgi:hypothetical protein
MSHKKCFDASTIDVAVTPQYSKNKTYIKKDLNGKSDLHVFVLEISS